MSKPRKNYCSPDYAKSKLGMHEQLFVNMEQGVMTAMSGMSFLMVSALESSLSFAVAFAARLVGQ
jgi:hypothetical protein